MAASWSRERPPDAHKRGHRTLCAGAAIALAVLGIAVVRSINPPGAGAMLLLLAVLLIGLVHWLVAVWGWRFQFHSLRAYLDSWWPPGDQRRVLATWPAAALEAGVVRKGAGKKVAILSPDGVHIQPRGVTLTFTTPADSSLHATLQRAAPGLAGHYGRPVDVRHHEGIAHVTVAYRDPLAVARQASNRSHGRH